MGARIDLTGQTIYAWKFLAYVGNEIWECRCLLCGCIKRVQGYSIRIGDSKSCNACALAKRTTHGMEKTPEYQAWRSILKRCLNPTDKNYFRYGGRGITVEWQSFAEFFADMGARPTPAHSIDRVDNNAGYSKENCRWATKQEQSNNMRTNHWLTFQGRTLTVKQWARETGISDTCLHERLKRGWSVERALTQHLWSAQLLTFQGRTLSVHHWAKETGIQATTLHTRLKRGWSVQETLTKLPIKLSKHK